MVKHSACNFTAFTDIFITAVSNTGNNTDFFWTVHICQEILNCFITCSVMCKVDHHLKILAVEYIQPSRSELCSWDKCSERICDLFNLKTMKVGRQTGSQNTCNHEFGFAFHRCWNVVLLCNADFPAPCFDRYPSCFTDTRQFSSLGILSHMRIVLVRTVQCYSCRGGIERPHGRFIDRIKGARAVLLPTAQHYPL